jgi:hypothetical protein
MTGFRKRELFFPCSISSRVKESTILYWSYLRRFAREINIILKEWAFFSKVKHPVMTEIDGERILTSRLTTPDAGLHHE